MIPFLYTLFRREIGGRDREGAAIGVQGHWSLEAMHGWLRCSVQPLPLPLPLPLSVYNVSSIRTHRVSLLSSLFSVGLCDDVVRSIGGRAALRTV